MLIRTASLCCACLTLAACAAHRSEHATAAAGDGLVASASQPLVIGETFTIDSRIMGEARRINVFVPTVYGEKIEAPMGVLYMLDGGMDEDFLHIAGLVQVLVSDGSMRPFMVVGIKNTQRRRDMTGPTTNAEDKKIAPVVGGSATFRRFIRDELMPTVRARYATSGESAIIGESLAGLFVMETFFLEPDLFGTYIAIDPSLWWANGELLAKADGRLKSMSVTGKSVFMASSDEPTIAKQASQLAVTFEGNRGSGAVLRYEPLPAESHATIYHPAAMAALRTVFAPLPAAK